MSRFITKTVNLCFWIFCVLFLFCTAFAGGSVIFSDIRAAAVAVFFLFLALIFLIFGGTVIEFLRKHFLSPLQKISTLKMIVIIGLVTLVSKLIFVWLFQNDASLHADMRCYLSFANQIARDGKITEFVSYAQRYKRTAIFGLILSPFSLIFGESTQALTTGLSIMVTVVSILLFDIIRKYTGNPIAFVGILIYNLMPFGLFQTQLLVHETALLFFHILSFWLLFKANEAKYPLWTKLLLAVASAVSIGIGKSINPAGSVILISFAIYTFINIVREKLTFKKLVSYICFLLIFVLCMSATGFALTKIITPMIPVDNTYLQNTEKKVSNGWTFYVALNYETHGGWSQEDYDTYYHYENIEDPIAAKEYQINLIKDRLNQYKEDPIKIPTHLFNKFNELWGDLWLPFRYEQGNHIEHWVYTAMGHWLYVLMYLSVIFCYVIVLMTILFSRKKKKNGTADFSPAVHFKMVVLGVTVALLFSEVSPKYISHLIILIFALWILNIKAFCEISCAIKERMFRKLKKANQ